MTRPRGDDGTALVEFTYLAVLVMVPVVYLLLTVFQVQSAAFGVTEAARQAGRAYVRADTTTQGQQRARAAADLVMADQGITGAAPPSISCRPLPRSQCLNPGTRVVVTVSYRVRLRFLGALFVGTQEPTIPVSATHVQYVDQAQAAP